MKFSHKKSMIFACLNFAILFCLTPALGAVWYVDGDASAGGDGQSWANAFNNIPSAISAASSLYNSCMAPTDQIWVKEGVYHLSSSILVSKIVTIYGGFDGSETSSSQRDWQNNPTIIDGNNSVRCFMVPNLCKISGFTIRNGRVTTNSGGAIFIDGGLEYCGMWNRYYTPTIEYCEFVNNSASMGGGIFIRDSAPTIKNCRFSDNSASTGGAIYHQSSSPKIEQCVFTDNTSLMASSHVGGAISGVYGNYTTETSTELTNCLFFQNSSNSWGGAISYNEVYPIITNCSFSENDASYGGGGFRGSNSSEAPVIRNSIFWGDTPDELVINTSNIILNVSYSDIQGGWTGPGAHNIDVNPQFVPGGELHLTQITSPCIDSGQNSYAPAADLEGVSRPIDGDNDGTATCDMGVWEESGIVSSVENPSFSTSLLNLHNQPNPFNPLTSIRFYLPEASQVSLKVFDMAGHLVDVLAAGQTLPAGPNSVRWNGTNLEDRQMPSGVYFYKLSTEKLTETKRMLLVR